MPVAMPIQTDWLKSVLIDRGYLARIKGEAIKVYLVMLEACGGIPDQSVTMSLNQLMDADPPLVPDGDRQPLEARRPRPGRLDDPRARQGQDLLCARPAVERS